MGNVEMSANTTMEVGVAEQFQDVIVTRVQPFICACGILGNALILVVWARYRAQLQTDSQETVVHLGLSAMAVSDLLFCVCLLPRVTIKESNIVVTRGSFAQYYQMYAAGLITLFSFSSTWLITVTAGIRYIAICHPFYARRVMSNRGVIIACVSTYCFCILASLPTFWLHTYIPLDGSNLGYVDLGPFSHVHPRGVAYIWAKAVLSLFVPLIVLSYFNIRLIIALRLSSALQRRHASTASHTTNRRRELGKARLTRTLVAAVLLFVILVCPCELIDFFAYIFSIFSTSVTTDSSQIKSLMVARLIANTMLVCNFAFNFILYCAVNGTFRKEFMRLLLSVTCLRCHSFRQYLGLVPRHPSIETEDMVTGHRRVVVDEL